MYLLEGDMKEPNGQNRNHSGPRDVLSKAWADLAGLDIEELSRRGRAEFKDKESAIVDFMTRKYVINRATRNVSRFEDDKVTNPFIAALILHYLLGAKDVEESGRLLTFRELEGGDVYYQAFYRRAIKPLADEIGPTPALLFERARRVGGERLDLGDASVRIHVFARVPVVIVVWAGDEEVPSSANILFDSTAGHHLHTEDLAAVGDLVADAIILSDDEWRGW